MDFGQNFRVPEDTFDHARRAPTKDDMEALEEGGIDHTFTHSARYVPFWVLGHDTFRESSRVDPRIAALPSPLPLYLALL